jgi:hypothetical protein
VHCLFISCRTPHPDQEMVLIFNQENQNILTETIFTWSHIVGRMREHARLKDCGQILRGHTIFVGFGSENCKQVEDVEKKLSIQGGQLGNQLLICLNCFADVKTIRELRSLSISNSLHGVTFERLSKPVVEV